jgi:DNA (cytosine-5)-methyltransferase 1
MSWDKLSPTITTQFTCFGTGRFGHPTQNRALSLREGALLQTFPETYSFVPDDKEVVVKSISRQIGNAVPPRLGEVIGSSIIRHLG